MGTFGKAVSAYFKQGNPEQMKVIGLGNRGQGSVLITMRTAYPS